MFKRFSAFLAAILVASCAIAQAAPTVATAKVSWVAPSTDTSGVALTAATVAALTYNVFEGAPGAVKVKVASLVAGGTTSIANAKPGDCFDVTTVLGTYESAHSLQACLQIIPNAPTQLTVTITIS